MRYDAHIRLYDENGDDYIYESGFTGSTIKTAFSKAYNWATFSDNARFIINVHDTEHPEHGEWCVQHAEIN